MNPSGSVLACASNVQVATVQSDVNAAVGAVLLGSRKSPRVRQSMPSIAGPLTTWIVPATARPFAKLMDRSAPSVVLEVVDSCPLPGTCRPPATSPHRCRHSCPR